MRQIDNDFPVLNGDKTYVGTRGKNGYFLKKIEKLRTASF